MEPQHVSAQHFFAETFHSQLGELLALQEGNDRRRPPIADCVQIKGEIAIPVAGRRMLIIFSWAESDPYPSKLGTSSYGCDLERVGQRCFSHLQFQSCCQLQGG